MNDIVIVYYIYINPKANWKCIVGGQIDDIKQVGLFDKAVIHCVICAENEELITQCKEFINESSINYSWTTVNNYEYPGMLKLYELGKKNPEHIFLYMHSKGMVFNNGSNQSRNPFEYLILRNTIKYHEYICDIFKKYDFIEKIGLFPDHSGIIWWNFYWIRGSFFKDHMPPEISTNRYYYESEYIVNKTHKNNCFNLTSFDTKTYNHMEGAHGIRHLRNCFEENISNFYFNVKKYLSKYPDLSINGIIDSTAFNHFLTHGINEGRDLI
jgi:hypothetical protein